MKGYTTKAHAALTVIIFLLLVMGCAGKKAKDGEHFGTGVNHPTFNGPGDFFGRLAEVNSILFLHRLNGEPVDMDWIDPAFREKLCLKVNF